VAYGTSPKVWRFAVNIISFQTVIDVPQIAVVMCWNCLHIGVHLIHHLYFARELVIRWMYILNLYLLLEVHGTVIKLIGL
jgi:hypothetical protein